MNAEQLAQTLRFFTDLAQKVNPQIEVKAIRFARDGFAGSEIYDVQVSLGGVDIWTDGSGTGDPATEGLTIPRISATADGKLVFCDVKSWHTRKDTWDA